LRKRLNQSNLTIGINANYSKKPVTQ